MSQTDPKASVLSLLLVEDDPGHAELIIRGLQREDPEAWSIRHARSVAEARTFIDARVPDLVLADWILSDGEGIQLLKKDALDYPLYPVVIMTSFGNESIAVEAIKSGALDYIVKSAASLRDMTHVIERSLREWGHIQARKDAENRLLTSHRLLLEAYETTLEGWSKALNLRDQETEEHTRRAADKTIEILKQLGDFSEEDLRFIRWGALLHDIGKLAIPDRILLKPGPLDDEEWTQMRKHPLYARTMLESIEYLKPAIDIPYCHHEHWDGNGYPEGLSGLAIPIAARVFAIVDVWDALSSNRPYRRAWGLQEVRAYILDRAGTQFDPAIVAMIDHLGILW